MIIKKPYAFLIRYFKVINIFLSLLLIFLLNRLRMLGSVINKIYIGQITNNSGLSKDYIGFKTYLALFFIMILITLIILLLKRKKKPIYDYVFCILYLAIITWYLISVDNLFFKLNDTIVEQNSLKLYVDISFLIIIPIFYFIINYILIGIGFNLKKFNFTKDIIELKQEEKDNEEVELMFNKNTYKYKRSIRRTIRELNYYYLENKLFVNIIIFAVIIVFSVTIFSSNLFNRNNVSLNKYFTIGNNVLKINNIYETKYDLNTSLIDKDYKFIIVGFNISKKSGDAKSFDFNRVRLFYKNKYVYANNYYNQFFYDLGVPYNGETITENNSSYLFIFKVPNSYKSNSYVLKFYDNIMYEKNGVSGKYKTINVKSKKIDEDINTINASLNENVVLNKKSYGGTNIIITDYSINSNYVYDDNNIKKIIRDKDINRTLLILDYSLQIDKDNIISDYFKDDISFFDKYISISYNYNNQDVELKTKCIGMADNKIMLSIPYEASNAKNIKLFVNLRNKKLVYNLK